MTITTANVGDTRIVLAVAGATAARRLTRDHNTNDPHEVARIEQSGGFIVKSRVLGILAITRSFGDQFLKNFVIATPDVNTVTLDDVVPCTRRTSHGPILPSSSFLIVACDGLWDVLTDQQAVDLVRQFPGNKEDVSEFLVQQALVRGTCDNLTVLVLWL